MSWSTVPAVTEVWAPLAAHCPSPLAVRQAFTSPHVSCQNERSLHRNRASAMKVLRARLYDLRIKEQQAKLEEIGGVKKDIAFGSQIRDRNSSVLTYAEFYTKMRLGC